MVWNGVEKAEPVKPERLIWGLAVDGQAAGALGHWGVSDCHGSHVGRPGRGGRRGPDGRAAGARRCPAPAGAEEGADGAGRVVDRPPRQGPKEVAPSARAGKGRRCAECQAPSGAKGFLSPPAGLSRFRAGAEFPAWRPGLAPDAPAGRETAVAIIRGRTSSWGLEFGLDLGCLQRSDTSMRLEEQIYCLVRLAACARWSGSGHEGKGR